MKSSGQGTFVSILDKEYCVNCPKEKAGELNQAAKYLDNQMRQIRKSGRVIGIERIAVMAALNIAYEFLALKENRDTPVTDFTNRIKLLHNKIDDALAKQLPHDNDNTADASLISDTPESMVQPSKEKELESEPL